MKKFTKNHPHSAPALLRNPRITPPAAAYPASLIHHTPPLATLRCRNPLSRNKNTNSNSRLTSCRTRLVNTKRLRRLRFWTRMLRRLTVLLVGSGRWRMLRLLMGGWRSELFLFLFSFFSSLLSLVFASLAYLIIYRSDDLCSIPRFLYFFCRFQYSMLCLFDTALIVRR